MDDEKELYFLGRPGEEVSEEMAKYISDDLDGLNDDINARVEENEPKLFRIIFEGQQYDFLARTQEQALLFFKENMEAITKRQQEAVEEIKGFQNDNT